MNNKCKKCNKEFAEAGALIFSPPLAEQTAKYHICPICYPKLEVWLQESSEGQEFKLQNVPPVESNRIPAQVGNKVTTGLGDLFAGTSWGNK